MFIIHNLEKHQKDSFISTLLDSLVCPFISFWRLEIQEKIGKARARENASIDCFSVDLLEEQHIEGDTCLKIEHFHRAAVVQGFIILLSDTSGQAQRMILPESMHRMDIAGNCLTSLPR